MNPIHPRLAARTHSSKPQGLRARVWVVWGMLAFLGGCDAFGSSSNTNGLTEGGVEEDGALPDAGTIPDASPPPDAAPDTGIDAATDAGMDADVVTQCPCPASTTCETWTCTPQNTCARTLAIAGTTCGELSERVCVEGACLVRGCGDGFLEPGPAPAAERCDDGNMVSGDGCTATCTIEQRTVAVDPTGESDVYIADGRQAIGIDAQGRALVVWALHEFSAQTSPGGPTFERIRLLARRYHANGAPDTSDAASPLVLDANLIAIPPVATPAVAGLPDGGWVVAWTAFRSNTYDIVFRVIGANGTIGAERVANQTRTSVQRKPAVVALDSGFVIAWESANATQTDPDGGVYARRFTSAGVSNGNELAIMSANDGIQANVALASRGAAWIAVWTDQQLANDYIPSLRMRRFNAGTATETQQSAPFSPTSSQPFVISSSTGYLVAYRTTHMDASGDIEHVFISETGIVTSMPTAELAMPSVGERAPTLAMLDETHYVMGYSVATESVSLTTDAMVAPAEWSSLLGALTNTGATRLALARSPYGLWVVWESNGLLGGGYGAAAWFWPSP